MAFAASNSQPEPSPIASSVGVSVQRASRLLTRLFDRALRATGLRFSQVVLLEMIASGRSWNETQLARLECLDPSSMSRRLQLLSDKGLVALTDAKHGRSTIPKLTDRGRRKLDQALSLWDEAQFELLNRVGHQHWSRLRTELDYLLETVES